LVRCDCTTRDRAKAASLEARIDELEARIAELAEKEELASIRPPLDGHQVMRILGVPPGPLVGEALDHLLEARLDEGPISEDDAVQRIKAWARARGLAT
jgi:poly(A) polymerase